MNHKHIEIALFRVSSDSRYLDIIFDCPEEYYFNTFLLEVRYLDKVMKSQFFDLSATLFNVDAEDLSNTINKKHWVVRIPLNMLGMFGPAIYKGTIKAQILPEAAELSESDCPPAPDTLVDHMVCSDVNYAYRCMLQDLLSIQ